MIRFLVTIFLVGFYFSAAALQISEVKMTLKNQEIVMRFIYPQGKIIKTNGNNIQSFWVIPPTLQQAFQKDHLELNTESLNIKYVLSEFSQAFVLKDKKESYVIILTNNGKRGENIEEAADYTCKSCTAIVGLSIVRLTKGYPELIAHQPFVTSMGSQSYLPPAAILQTGPEGYSLLFETFLSVGMGYSITNISLVDIALQRETLSTTFAKSLSFLCKSSDSPAKCRKYAYHGKLKVVRSPTQFGHYPIHIEKKGIDYDEANDKHFPAHVKEQYNFNGKAYILKK